MIERISSGLLASLLFSALPLYVVAQSLPPPEEARFYEEFSIKNQADPLSLTVFRRSPLRDDSWQVEVHRINSSERPICQTTLPPEAGGEFYSFHLLQLTGPSDQTILLVDALPSKAARRLDPPVYQVAFLLRQGPGERHLGCSVIARGEYSELDGGPALSFTDELPPRLLRRDSESSIRFCGLRPEEKSDAEVFDFQSSQFRPLAIPQIEANQAPELPAILPTQPIPPPLTEGFYAWVTSTSDHRGAPPGAALPRPMALGDLDFMTAWISGEEEEELTFLTAGINEATELRALRIFPGHGRSAEHFDHYARLAKALLSLENGQRYLISLPDLSLEELQQADGLLIELPEPVQTRCASLLLMSAHQGTSEAIAISEITFYSALDNTTEDETARQIIAAIANEPDRQRRDQIAGLASSLPQAIAAAIEATLQGEDQVRRERVLPLLGRLTPEKALPILEDHFLRITPDDKDYRLTKRIIASFTNLASPTLFAILDELPAAEAEKNLDILRLIGRVASPEELTPLTQNLGQGDDLLRRERIRALAAAGAPILPALLSTVEEEIDSPSGLDGLSAIVLIGKRYFPDGDQNPNAGERLWQIYQKSKYRSHRIRAIEAQGYLLHPDGSSLLQDQVLTVDPDPILRSFAARALENYPGEAPRKALEAALDDESPDVRISAIETLYKRPDSAESTEAVISYLDGERWPQGLSYGVQLLANSPSPQALSAIAELVTDDISSQTSANALRALRRNEQSFDFELLEKFLTDQTTPHRVQSQLVDMLTYSDDHRADPTLIAIADGEHPLHSTLTAAQQDDLQRRALIALGARGDGAATDYLLSFITDSQRALPHREAALRGLAFTSDLSVYYELQDLAGAIPSELRSQFRQTLGIIRNRITLDDADREIQDRLDRLEEEQAF